MHAELQSLALDGQEVHQTIWFDHERQEETECLFEEILSRLNSYNSTQLQQAVVAKLAERILGLASEDNISQLQARHQKREHEHINQATKVLSELQSNYSALSLDKTEHRLFFYHL